MVPADLFLDAARERGFDFFTGVPCSYLTPLINRVISDRGLRYIGATSEGEAIGIAAGAYLGGRMPVVMLQNSGLGNTVNPLTSLNHPFRIPSLLIVTWRGKPGTSDEPQHTVMGQVTHQLLQTIGIRASAFPEEEYEVRDRLSAANAHMKDSGLPYALVMPKGSVVDEPLQNEAPVVRAAGRMADYRSNSERPRRIDVLAAALSVVPETAAVIATTGKCGRELFTLADRAQHLYVVGSMGCASALGLGVATHVPNKVVVLDGDGAALMKMGNMATIGATAPANLIHIILDNGTHDSTGGQATASAHVDFAAVAVASSYRSGAVCDDTAGFERAMSAALHEDGPHLIHVRIQPGSIEKLGRPTVPPHEVAQRFRSFLSTSRHAV